jgi:hypothetical protein
MSIFEDDDDLELDDEVAGLDDDEMLSLADDQDDFPDDD